METAKHSLKPSYGQKPGRHTDAFYRDPACLFPPRILETYGCEQHSAAPLEAEWETEEQRRLSSQVQTHLTGSWQ